LIDFSVHKYTLEKTEETIKNGQSRNTVNIGFTRHKTKTKQKAQDRKLKR